MFRPGDKVRCIDPGAKNNLVKDREYTVESATGGLGRFVRTTCGREAFSSRFELVKPPEPRVIRKTLLIEAQPEGGFTVSEPYSNPFNERKNLAAFSRLSEALGFIEEAMA